MSRRATNGTPSGGGGGGGKRKNNNSYFVDRAFIPRIKEVCLSVYTSFIYNLIINLRQLKVKFVNWLLSFFKCFLTEGEVGTNLV